MSETTPVDRAAPTPGPRTDRADAIIDRILAGEESYHGGAWKDVKRLWREYLHPYRFHIVAATLLACVATCMPLLLPMTGRYLFDEVLQIGEGADPVGNVKERLGGVWLVFALNIGFWTVFAICAFVQMLLLLETSRKMVFRLRQDLHKKLQALHIGFYERTPTGRIISRVIDDVGVMHKWVANQGMMFVGSAVRFLASTGLAFYIDATLALMLLATLPFYALAFARLRPRIRRANIALRRLNSAMYGESAEKINGIRVVQAFARERSERRTFAKKVFEFLRVQMRLVYYNRGLTWISQTISGGMITLAIYVGMSKVRAGTMSFGDIVAYLGIAAYLFEPIATLTMLFTNVQAVFVILRRVFHLLDEPEEVSPGRITLTGMEGRIHFDAVSFTYPGQVEPALRELKFRIRPGERVALMGPSGSGKSTIFQLLMRFYDPQVGAVRVGGVNLADADPGSVRRHVCMVQQEPVVFSGTIADNIIYGRLDATPAMVMEAARRAELHDFILSLPVKYETVVGENGVTLSGGQKQRLALATALLTDPEVLLLDDTTSALDAGTEARIRETLNRVLEGRTSLTITQRIATARDSDRILVLENGCLTQEGTHEQLRHVEGFYRRICRQQESV